MTHSNSHGGIFFFFFFVLSPNGSQNDPQVHHQRYLSIRPMSLLPHTPPCHYGSLPHPRSTRPRDGSRPTEIIPEPPQRRTHQPAPAILPPSVHLVHGIQGTAGHHRFLRRPERVRVPGLHDRPRDNLALFRMGTLSGRRGRERYGARCVSRPPAARGSPYSSSTTTTKGFEMNALGEPEREP